MIALLLLLIISVTGIARTTDPILTIVAERRVIEVQTNWSHEGKPPDVAEVLAFNSGYKDPLTQALLQWQGSPDHWDILTNTTYTRIGCASDLAKDGATTFVVCELSWPTAPTVVGPAPSIPRVDPLPPAISVPIPDTDQGASSATSGTSPPEPLNPALLLALAGVAILGVALGLRLHRKGK